MERLIINPHLKWGLVTLITDIPDGVMLEVELGEEDADDRREGV